MARVPAHHILVFSNKICRKIEKCSVSKAILTVLLTLSFAMPISAETIMLKSGKTIERDIVERTDEYIKVDFHGITLTHYLDEIESIDDNIISLPVNINKDKITNTTRGEASKKPKQNLKTVSAKQLELEAAQYMQIGRYQEAIDLFGKTLEVDPKHMAAYRGLSRCYSRIGKQNKAIEICKEGIQNMRNMNRSFLMKFQEYIYLKGNMKKLLMSVKIL